MVVIARIGINMSNDIIVKNTQSITQNVVDDLGAVSEALMTLAKDKDFDVEKMQAIMTMRISMIDRQAKIEFDKDFFEMKKEIPVILKKGQIKNNAGNVTSTYSRFEDIQEALEPLYRKYNFYVMHTPSMQADGKHVITTKIKHTGGHEESISFVSPPDKTNALKGDMQAAKSTVSFGKRVNLINLFDLTEATEDSEIYQNQKITIEQAQEIDLLIEQTGSDRDKLLAFCKAETSLDITIGKYKDVIRVLTQKLGKPL
jgi:hypothetical protein